MVADKGYHSGAVVMNLQSAEVRTYVPEKKQPGHRHWEGKAEEQQAVYANRRRVQGAYGQRLLRRRGELLERHFAHCYDTGGMRRTHLRGHKNILKRLLIHVGAFNLSLILRTLLGSGTPRELENRRTSLVFVHLFRFRNLSAPCVSQKVFVLIIQIQLASKSPPSQVKTSPVRKARFCHGLLGFYFKFQNPMCVPG